MLIETEIYIVVAVVVAIMLVTAALTIQKPFQFMQYLFHIKKEERVEIYHDAGVALMTAGIGMLLGEDKLEGAAVCVFAFILLRIASQMR
ncbi:MAG: hypothetical protein JHC38_04595 [Thiotrichales bacterium]|jgi:hypothetical protein|nr:hypothetical protein [Thiotrichales bacterium]